MKTKGFTSVWCRLAVVAWLGTNPVSAQQFLRAPAAPATDLVSARPFTRTFAVNPNAFFLKLDHSIITGKPVEKKNIQEYVRDYFASVGLNLDGNNGPRFFFNERTGRLTVQGTIAELEAVENALQALTTDPALVAIEVRLVEATDKVELPALTALLRQLETDNQDLPSALPLQTSRGDDSKPTMRTAVLTQREFTDFLKAAEQKSGIDMITRPRTVTISGRQARIAVENPSEPMTDPPIHGGRRMKLNAE